MMSRAAKDTRPFHFKPFSLYHHKSTMKTGTDAILLGVWSDVSEVTDILDIGCGSGIISLLIASRCSAKITSIDIDDESVLEASSNFANSPFANRMNVEKADFFYYSQKNLGCFDLVVSNPPFFTNDLKSIDKRRANARHTTELSFNKLCSGVSSCLSPTGKFCVVIPYYQLDDFKSTAANNGLFLNKQMIIFSRRAMPPNRINLEFSKDSSSTIKIELFVIREENNTFTNQYRQYLDDFYLSIPEK